MPVTLLVSDDLDGSGGVATIAGGGAGDSNTLYRATWAGTTGTLTWTLVGSRTGNGAISIDVTPGHYLFRLDNLITGVTTVVVVYQPLTDAATKAMLDRALDAAVTRVSGLALPGSPAVSKRWLPRVKPGDSLPIIAVTPVGGESFPGGLTTQDDIGLPIAVTIMDAANQDPTANLSRDTLYREKILSALRYQRLAGVSEAYILNPEPGMIVNPGMFDDKNLIFSPLFFRLITRTQRG